MSLFSKKNTKELTPLFSASEIDGASYDQVLDFLVSVNDDDFTKITQVAERYRKTHLDVAEITGLKLEPVPSIFETQTVPPQVVGTPLIATPGAKAPDTDAGDFLDDEELKTAFLDDEEPAKKTVKVDVQQGS